MPNLSASQLERALDKIFEYMEERGIKIDDDKKADFKKQIADELHNELSFDDVKDVNVQKKLISCVTSLIMGKDKDFKEMLDTLKTPDKKDQADEKLDKKLTAELMLLALLTKVLDPDRKKANILTPDQFKKKLLDDKDEQKDEKKEMEPSDEMSKQLDASLRNLYGGNNPTINGEIDFPILGPVVGNLFAFTNQTKPDPNALSEMVESITYNKGKVDYMGLENTAMLQDMADGGIDVSCAVSPTLSPGSPAK